MPNSKPDNFPRLTYRRSLDKLHDFIASLPGMACQIEQEENDSIRFVYVSEGCSTLLEASPRELLDDATNFLVLIHPEDATTFRHTLQQSAYTQSFWNWEGRITFRGNAIKWVSLGATPHMASNGLTCWEGILLDITQSKLGELEARRAQQQLQELTSHIQDAKEQERLNIAREVHDEIGSMLTAIKIDLSLLIQQLPDGNQPLTDRATAIAKLVNKAIDSASNLAYNLRPSILDHFGLVAAIENEVREFIKRSGIHCTMHSSQPVIELPSRHAITLYRIFQEAINNILKHAQANNVLVEIVKGGDHIELVISDDGAGFDNTAQHKPHSFGLRGIHERVEHLGGTVRIASSAASGTQLSIFIPLAATEGISHPPQQALFSDPPR